MVNMKTSLAAQRTEMYKEQGFKNMFVKVSFTKALIFPYKNDNKTQQLLFFQKKTTLIYPKNPPCVINKLKIL